MCDEKTIIEKLSIKIDSLQKIVRELQYKSKIDSCPFCGCDNAEILEYQRGKLFTIMCNTCGAKGPVSDSLCYCIEKWNRRGSSGFWEE